MLGTGVGMERRERGGYRDVYEGLVRRERNWTGLKVHNVLTVVKRWHGWLGLVLYVAFVGEMARPLTRKFGLYVSLFVMLFLYHFACGQYLTPPLWLLLSVIASLRRTHLGGARHS